MTAHSGVRRRRGEPLLALALLLGGWTSARIMLWQSPFAHAAPSLPTLGKGVLAKPVVVEPTVGPVAVGSAAPAGNRSMRQTDPILRSTVSAYRPEVPRAAVAATFIWTEPTSALLSQPPAFAKITPVSPSVVQPLPIVPSASPGRWHLAAWAAWRQGSGLPLVANGARPASYGGSQLGALLQFDLAAGSHRPAIHARASYAPDRPHQSEIAAGAGFRPEAQIPVRLMGELRAARTAGKVEVRPALLAVTELRPIQLPLALTAEGYGQGGWVGGRYATAFVDGQARVTREVDTLGHLRARLGGGAWGGAQKFAHRLDVGPTVSVEVARGGVSARLSMDYRIRVAGSASPGSGLVATLSTGF